ncbi:hypothetical protein AOU35_003533 [Salmonella enterica]|nr:hypothetical protein [Salmonella enterica]EAX4058940.1 hypothetical protein [Salmonella enterica]EDW9233218.1 hypothetical protein [Salmonella enterica]
MLRLIPFADSLFQIFDNLAAWWVKLFNIFHDFHLKKMPGRTGRTGSRGAFLGCYGFTTQRHRNGALV